MLLKSWKESLLLFAPKNFKLFLLVTFKSAAESYSLLFYYFWWLLLLAFALAFGCFYHICMPVDNILHWLYQCLQLILFCILVILVRPSLMVKNRIYVRNQLQQSWFGFLMLYGIISLYITALFVVLLTMGWIDHIFTHFYGGMPLLLFYNDLPVIVMPSFIIPCMFYYDSAKYMADLLGSLWRGMIMILFNLPFFMISMLFFIGFYGLLLTFFDFYGYYLFFSFIPFVVSYFKNIYVKRLHDQFNLYYVA